jgi:hypothetical protein
MRLIRSGAVLILIAGIASIFATMTLAFLVSMRNDMEESRQHLQDVQAHIMLTAALQYVAESSRVGWRDASGKPTEAFGWVDVRDGSAGPKGFDGAALYAAGSYPAPGTWARCPMHQWQRPKYAIRTQMVYNAIGRVTASSSSWPWGDLITTTTPNPMPQVEILSDFENGDAAPIAESLGLSWFRVYRMPVSGSQSPARFILACGAGASLGYRSFAEAAAAGDGDLFGSRQAFDEIRAVERILWYETEWNPAVGMNTSWHYSSDYHLFNLGQPGPYVITGYGRNFCGTFLYVQRLVQEPTAW